VNRDPFLLGADHTGNLDGHGFLPDPDLLVGSNETRKHGGKQAVSDGRADRASTQSVRENWSLLPVVAAAMDTAKPRSQNHQRKPPKKTTKENHKRRDR
jgi:hypothetical protein